MPDDVFIKLPKCGNINFRTVKHLCLFFQFCSRKPSANIVTSGRNDNNDTGELDSDEGTGHEEKASDEMAMELFSSIAKVEIIAKT